MPGGEKTGTPGEESPGRACHEFADVINQVLQDVFENDCVRATIGYLFLIRGHELDEPGQGYIVRLPAPGDRLTFVGRRTARRTPKPDGGEGGGDVYEGQAPPS